METRGMENSPFRRKGRRGWGWLRRLCARALKHGRSACSATKAAIVFMVAEPRKRKVCSLTQAGSAARGADAPKAFRPPAQSSTANQSAPQNTPGQKRRHSGAPERRKT